MKRTGRGTVEARGIAAIVLITAVAGIGAGCKREEPAGAPATHAAAEGPHGGTLVELGNDAATFEAVFEPSSGKLTVYLLGPGAQSSVRLPVESLPATIILPGKDPIDVELQAVATPSTGETVGDSSQFSAVVQPLLNAGPFTLRIDRLMVRGMEYRSVEVQIETPHAP